MSVARRLLFAFFVASFCLAGSSPRAVAQMQFDDFWGSIFAPHRAKPPVEYRPRPIHHPKHRPVAASPKPASPAAASASTPAAKTSASFFIAVLGDSQANMLAQGLAEAYADDPRVAVLNKARVDTGLVRDDFYDWRAAAETLLDGPQHIDLAVIQIGTNDNQKLRVAGVENPEPLSKPFNEVYAKRVEELAALFREKKTPLVWVGLPIMRSESLSNAALVFNDIDKTYAEAQGARYVDLWEAFSDENSVYRASGPDLNGAIVRLRAADGVHFNKAGARKAAHFVEPEIRKVLEAALQPNQPPGAAPEAPAQPAPPGGAEAPGPEQAQPAAPPPKPIAGKIENLSDAVVSPGGALAAPPGAKAASKSPDAAPFQRGRADDFTWQPK
jgi:hypothetical protein